MHFAFVKLLATERAAAGAPGAGASEEAAAGQRDSPAQAGSAAGADAGPGPGQAVSSGASLRSGRGSSAAAPDASGLGVRGGEARGLVTSAPEGERGSRAGAGSRGGLGRIVGAARVGTSDEEDFSGEEDISDDEEEEVRPARGRTIHRRAQGLRMRLCSAAAGMPLGELIRWNRSCVQA